jgi:hypothetical protein
MNPRENNLLLSDMLDHLAGCRSHLERRRPATVEVITDMMMRDLTGGRRLCETIRRTAVLQAA